MSDDGADAAQESASQPERAPAGQPRNNEQFTKKANPNLGPLTGREKEFAELGNLTELYEGLATKTRQHVNPLANNFQKPTPAPDWHAVFADPQLPLQVDVGCGSGRFVLIRALRAAGRSSGTEAAGEIFESEDAVASEEKTQECAERGEKRTSSSKDVAGGDCENVREAKVAKAAAGEFTASSTSSSKPESEGAAPASTAQGDVASDCAGASASSAARANVLGLEIRQKLVDRAQEWTKRLQLRNCKFLFTNVTVSWKSLLESYPGPIELVSMQFPDPHFKSRHHKRRHVQPPLVQEMAETLADGARVFLQGDVPEVVRWMRDMFDLHGRGQFAVAPECRGASLERSEWETPAEEQSSLRTQEDGQQQSQPTLRFSADTEVGWLSENPLGVPTEREVYVAQIKAPVYRVVLVNTKGVD